MASRALIAVSMCFVTGLQLAGASGPTDKLNGLLDNSPFGVSRANAGPGNSTNDPLAFRGVFEEKGTRYFSIYETAAHRSTWVELNDPVDGFAIKGYDADHEIVTVEYQNRTLTLTLKPAPAVAQAPMPVGPVPMPGSMLPSNSQGFNAPSPADSQRLLQIQEEIRRRRALRQQQVMPMPTTDGRPGPQQFPSNTAGPQQFPSNSAGPQQFPSNSAGPQPYPSNAPGPQPVTAKP